MDVKKPAISQWGSVRTLDRDLCPLEHNSSPNEHTNGSAEYKPDVNHLTSENSSTCIASSLMGGGNCKYLSAEQSWSRELQFQGAASIPHQCHSDTQVTRTFSHNLDLVWDTSVSQAIQLYYVMMRIYHIRNNM